jgi:hypothetical protein
MLEMLHQQGDLYTYSDIMDCIHSGKMQSFVAQDTWVVTQVHEFPQKKVVDIVFVLGDESGLKAIEPRLLEFKERIGADYLSATGRKGWLKKAFPGWELVSVNFIKV